MALEKSNTHNKSYFTEILNYLSNVNIEPDYITKKQELLNYEIELINNARDDIGLRFESASPKNINSRLNEPKVAEFFVRVNKTFGTIFRDMFEDAEYDIKEKRDVMLQLENFKTISNNRLLQQSYYKYSKIIEQFSDVLD